MKTNTKTINFMSFLTGIRGDSEFQVQTNVEPTSVGDYIEASAGIDMNIMLLIFKSGGLQSLETFFKMKEILMLNSLQLMKGHSEEYGLSEEQYTELREYFNLDKVEEQIKEQKESKRDEILKAGKAE